MIRYGKSTALRPDEVIARAVKYFGPGGEGLEVRERDDHRALLTGGGGHVAIEAIGEGDATRVDLSSKEWDQPAKMFLQDL